MINLEQNSLHELNRCTRSICLFTYVRAAGVLKNKEMQAVAGIKAGLCNPVIADALMNESLSDEIAKQGLNLGSLHYQQTSKAVFGSGKFLFLKLTILIN